MFRCENQRAINTFAPGKYWEFSDEGVIRVWWRGEGGGISEWDIRGAKVGRWCVSLVASVDFLTGSGVIPIKIN